MVKGQRNRNKISIVQDSNGLIKEGDEVAAIFLALYNNFLDKGEEVESLRDAHSLFSKRLTHAVAMIMIREVHEDEIKEAMFGIGEGTAPGFDGFTSAFFKSAWDVVVCV